jgi:hypothetical protein
MPVYEEIRNEFREIAEILKLYPETLQIKVFDILVSQYLNVDISVIEVPITNNDNIGVIEEMEATKEEREQPIQAKSVKKKNPSKQSFQIVKDMNLRGANGKPSFSEFCDLKKPKSNIEFNVVAIYYLSKVLELENTTLDHIYTCYKEASRPLPINLRQGLIDTSGSKYGYINIKGNDYSIPVRGENLVEHELPRQSKEAK